MRRLEQRNATLEAEVDELRAALGELVIQELKNIMCLNVYILSGERMDIFEEKVKDWTTKASRLLNYVEEEMEKKATRPSSSSSDKIEKASSEPERQHESSPRT